MPYYFMRDTPLQALEQLMMSQPGQKPRGGGIYRSPFHYTPKDVACEYVTVQSCKNQFYSDLVTPLPDKINVPGTEIHIFYALKMGEKYRERYERHFANPVIHEQDLQHEELLACYPERWAQLVKDIMEGKQ